MSRLGMDSRPVTKIGFLRRWVTARLGSIRHEHCVANIASALVGATSPLHQLTRTQRRLLKMAAIVHDVGRCVDDKEHPAIGAEMLLGNQSLPLRRSERRALAYLTLYHRGQVPEIGEDVILRDSDDRQGLLTILGFLRAADCLNSRSLPSPRIGVCLRGRRVKIDCRIEEESAKARRVFTRRKKYRLLEEALDCRVDVTVECRGRLRMVA
jgi:exopolyphosphatase/guanosine-5'-triphosphate,3'-diphosphate pyrophosphatase